MADSLTICVALLQQYVLLVCLLISHAALNSFPLSFVARIAEVGAAWLFLGECCGLGKLGPACDPTSSWSAGPVVVVSVFAGGHSKEAGSHFRLYRLPGDTVGHDQMASDVHASLLMIKQCQLLLQANPSSGVTGVAYTFVLGLLTACWSLTGYDSAAHLIEVRSTVPLPTGKGGEHA